MSERQLRGAGLVLLSFLVTALIVGTAWRSATPLPGHGATVEESGPQGERPAEGGEPPRHIEVPAGWRAEQVAHALDKAGLADGKRFLALVRKDGLEGRLFPGIYDVRAGFSADTLIAEMAKRFEQAFTPRMRRRARELGLSVKDVVTLASIVQREMVYASEAPVIAGVYHNRLRAGIRLKADPTVIYALDSHKSRRRYWDRGLSRTDLRLDSPYNTYLRKGLPPGPIASPSREAIMAALYPADVDYRFFVARGNGTHEFARTGREHVANVERYRAGRTQVRQPGSDLQQIVERLMGQVPGHVGVVVKNLATGESASLHGDELFTAASLYKLAVMLTAFEHRAQGRLSFDERLSIPPYVAAKDYPELQARLGTRPTVRKAIDQMIVVSSNAAGVTLLRKLGRGEVDRVLREHGLQDTSLVSRRIVTTPRDIARLLELMATGRAVSRKASAEMIGILLRQEIDDRLPKYLPKGVALAHKTGTLDFPSHDAGILYARHGPIVIVAMTEDVSKRAAATESVARLGRVVYDYFESYKPIAERLGSRGNSACPASPFGPRARGALSGKTIVLDPGHGGASDGVTFAFRDGFVLKEKDVDLDVALRLKDTLVARGATVHMTRCRDAFRSLMARSALANAARPDLILSLHVNGARDPGKDGTEVDYFLPDGKVVANYLLGTFARPALWETLSAGQPLSNGGAQRRRLDGLVYTLAPTAQTESVFLTNPAEAAALRAAGGARRAEIARGHLRGILNYFGVKSSPHRAVQRASAPPRAPAGAEVRIAATGDIAMGRTPMLPFDGGASLFSQVRPYLAGDLVLGNLEGTLALGGTSKCAGRASSSSCYAFRAPPWYAYWLKRAGFTVLNLANNHSYDFGAEGAAETVDALDRAGLLHTGRAGQIARQQVGPVRVAIVGFAPSPWAQSMLDLAEAQRLVRRADAWADLVLVTMHAGAEGSGRMHVRSGPETYLGEARGDPVAFAHAVIDAGADLVVGHGPHVLRGMEWYRGRLIAYSLGNFAGYGNFSLGGPLGVSGILQVTLRADGSWRRGRLVGIHLIDGGTPVPDPTAAPSLVRTLSRDDFGPRAVWIGARGGLRKPSGRTGLTPREKAALVVVSGLPAPTGVAGVIVQRWSRHLPRPPGALVFVDQEGRGHNAIPELPPRAAASAYAGVAGAFAAGRATGEALRRVGVHVDLAPVLDSRGGPLGSRHFRDPTSGVAFARGLAVSRAGACAKHFPGLGATRVSTDMARVQGTLRARELEGFRAAIRAGVPCVMVSHAVYPKLGHRPASLEPATYSLLRSVGFEGVAVTDALEVLGRPEAARWARLAVEAGADLVLFTSGRDAERAIDALVPLARQGLLDEHVARVLRLRRSFGLS